MPVGIPRSIAATRVLAIAQRLVIAEGTTQNYLSHMLDKLGVTSRTQVAALVLDKHGLLSAAVSQRGDG